MRKIVVGMFMSLDGVIEGPGSGDDFELAGWTDPYWDDGIGETIFASMMARDAMLMGRTTYESFKNAFSSSPAEDPFGSQMNSVTKYVVSTTLPTADWENSILIKEDVIEEIRKLKQQPGMDISISGSAGLVHSLMPHNLIDEYMLLVYPVVLGKGKRMFPDGVPMNLKLAETKSFNTGVVMLRYQRADET
jgi:dihydrofolate reductase